MTAKSNGAMVTVTISLSELKKLADLANKYKDSNNSEIVNRAIAAKFMELVTIAKESYFEGNYSFKEILDLPEHTEESIKELKGLELAQLLLKVGVTWSPVNSIDYYHKLLINIYNGSTNSEK